MRDRARSDVRRLARRGLVAVLGAAVAVSAATGSVSAAASIDRPAAARAEYVAREAFGEGGSITPLPVPPQAAPRISVVPQPARVEPVQVTGPSSDRVDVVFVGDGYTADDLAAYAAQVRAQWSAVTDAEPLRTYQSYFNVWRVDVVSAQSGVDNDPLGVERDTALDMTFWCGGMDRMLCIDTTKAFAYAANAPEVELIVALANSSAYGGGGYQGLATVPGGNPAGAQVAQHEIGHAFGGLADEYDYYHGGETNTYAGPEPREPNVTVYTTATLLAQQLKWYRWIGAPSADGSVVSSYEGALYYRYGIYRPTENSIMRALYQQFNPPGREALVEGIYRRARLLRTSYDDRRRLGGQAVVTLTTPVPVGGALDVRWYVDGTELVSQRGRKELALSSVVTPLESFELTVRVVDPTPFVRDETFRATSMQDARTWQVVIDRTPPDTTISQSPDEAAAVATRDATLAFGGMDDVTAARDLRFECSLDGAAFTACTSPVSLTSLPEGPHTFAVRANDDARNADPTPATRRWTVDVTAPETILGPAAGRPLALLPPAVSRSPSAELSFAGTDNLTPAELLTFRCSRDGTASACTSPARLLALREGKHAFAVSAVDRAGNEDATPARRSWTVDLAPPSKPRIIGPRRTGTARPSYRFRSHDSITAAARLRFRCAFDRRRLRACARSIRPLLSPGAHVLYAVALDEAGRRSAVAHARIVVTPRRHPRTTGAR